MPRPAFASALVCAGLALAGCGGGGGDEAASGGGRPLEGGTLDYALASDPRRLDPLLASDRASQVVTRQIHEPLVEVLTGPFGDLREVGGLARSSGSSGDATIWRFRLRPRIRFGDGTPFNASAVLANAERWMASPEGRVLLPDLAAVDAPQPDIVRFILDQPDDAFPERLSQARLGIVSPRTLRAASPVDGARVADGGSGTGAFEFREQEAGASTVLARNTSWWGTRLRLGPALDQLVFPVVPRASDRVAMLDDGQVEVADELDPAAAEKVRSGPLLAVEGGGAGPLFGIERSVRGIEAGTGVPVLSGTWLTSIGAEE
ncbi:MAG TPA: ABC transporter substrate-binding protein [Solirubrobacterales bacterium]